MMRRRALIGLGSLLVCLCLTFYGLMAEGKRRNWRLKGREILLELCGMNDDFPHGIYALDPFDPKPRLRLLLRGGRRPVWSPKRRLIGYLEDDYLCISDRQGNASRVFEVYLSNLGFHDPPVVWTWQEGLHSVQRVTSCGSKTYWCFKDLPADWKSWGIRGHFPGSHIVPLKRQVPLCYQIREQTGQHLRWDDLLCLNNPTFSPDGKFMAAEVYPAGPEDLLRAESRILVYDLEPPKPENLEFIWFFENVIISGKPGRRLTSLGEGTTELRPLWSPTGEWIAFTVVHWKEGYVTAAVIRPDGSDYTELLPPKAAASQIFWKPKWQPVTPLDLEDKRRLPTSTSRWGQPHVMAVEWSEDGKYLLLNQGKRYEWLQVAKWDKGQWWVGGVGGLMGSGDSGLKFAAWGPGRWVAMVADMGSQIWLSEVIYEQKGGAKQFNMPDGVWIEWMDW